MEQGARQAEQIAKRSYTVVTCHYGDPFWIEHMTTQVDSFSDDRVREVVVVDQDRGSRGSLGDLARVSRVVTFPVDEEEVRLLGHDHPASLNRVFRESSFQTTHVIILDSDCFPTRAGWLDQLADVTLARDPAKHGLSHPCLMVLPVEACVEIDFAEGLLDVGMDTGRLVGLQLARAGYEVTFSDPISAFRGRRGTFYLGGLVYHHGSASFVSSDDGRLRDVVNPGAEERYRRKIEAGEYDFTAAEFAGIRVRELLPGRPRPGGH